MDDVQETIRETIIGWHEIGMCRVPARHGAEKIIEQLRVAGYVIVPVKPTESMVEELARIGDGPMISGEEVWGYMLAAATAAANT